MEPEVLLTQIPDTDLIGVIIDNAQNWIIVTTIWEGPILMGEVNCYLSAN